MCGITALITLNRRQALDSNLRVPTSPTYVGERQHLESSLAASLEKIQHRGPDAQHVWISPDNTIGLGHCRLSIVDPTPGADQPLHSDDGHIHAVVMGEIYDDGDAIRTKCEQEFGYKFRRGRSDSELVVALYKHYRTPEFLEHLRGEYAFVIYDDRTGNVVAARDRFGVKPLFWTIVEGKLLLAAEMKAFLPMGWKPKWDVENVVLNSMYVGANTIFEDVYKLEPGHYLTSNVDGQIETHKYWDVQYKDKNHVETRTVDEMVQTVRETLIDSVRVRLRADVPVGIFLSGGLDSSAVAGIAKYLTEQKGEKMGSIDSKKKIACFTIQFDKDSGFDESDIAQRTANFLETDLYFKDMNEAELARHFEACCYHNEQPTWDFGPVGKFALSELPREQGFKVILSGEGADELFAGYPWFLAELLREPDPSVPTFPLQKNDPLRKTLKARASEDIKVNVYDKIGIEANFGHLPQHIQTAFNYVETPFATATRITPPEIYLSSLQQRLGPEAKARAVLDAWPTDVKLDMQGKWHPVHTAMYAWTRAQLPNFILTALGDRAEMAHSIEGRPPFLDHHLAELVQSMPPSLKMRYDPDAVEGPNAGSSVWQGQGQQANSQFWEKWLLREAAKPFITEELYLRRKHMYSAPFNFPEGGALHRLFQGLLTEQNVKELGFVHWPEVKRSLEKAFGGGADTIATRKVITVGSYVALSKQFGVGRASMRDSAVWLSNSEE